MAWERSQDLVQAIVDHAPKANWYFSDAFEVYASLWYHWGRYAVSDGKTDTYPVEGNNAELRHYLARLARSSRCFFTLSVCIALRCPFVCLLLQPSGLTARHSALAEMRMIAFIQNSSYFIFNSF